MDADPPESKPQTRRTAEARRHRIAQFRAELAVLEQEGALLLTPEQRIRLETHLDRLNAELVREHGLTEVDHRLSWGMRFTALLGAGAVFAGLVLLLHRIWGFLPGLVQIVLLTGFTLAFLAVAAWSNRRAWDPFFTGLMALVAGVAFVMDTTAMAVIHNHPGSPHALLCWALFALLVAYGLKTRVLLAAGVLLLCAYASALGQMLTGGWWAALLDRPGFMIPAAAIAYATPTMIKAPDPHRFGIVFRGCGAGAGLLALLLFSYTGHFCCLGLSLRTGETLCQLAGLGVAAGIVYHGLRLDEGSLANVGAIAFVTFLFARLHAWCWDWMPKYAFFFLLGLLAIVLLLVFRRLRLRASARGTP